MYKRFLLLSVVLFSLTAKPDVPDASVAAVDAGVAAVTLPSAPPDEVSVNWFVDSVKAIRDAVVLKDWGKLIFLVITVLVVICRKFLAPKVPFFNSKLGAPLLTFAWASAAALAASWTLGTKLTSTDIWMVLQAGIVAAGGWTLFKNILEHFEKPGNWAETILNVVRIPDLGPGESPTPPIPPPAAPPPSGASVS